MKNRIKKFMKKQWLLVWTLVVSVAMLTMIASAEYSSTESSMNRVVVSKKGPGMMFSSNFLMVDGDNEYHPIYVKSKESGAYDDDNLFIWNYNISDINRFYPNNINYKIVATLTDQNGDPLTQQSIDDPSSEYTHSVTIIDPQGNTIILNNANRTDSFENAGSKQTQQTLVHGPDAAQNRYTIRFSEGWDIAKDENICVQIIAIPTKDDNGNNYTDLKPISGVIGLKTTSGSGSNGWKASIAEQPGVGKTTPAPSAYDAYNLVLNGSGKATITIKWDTSKISLNKYFVESKDSPGAGGTRLYEFAAGEVEVGSVGPDGWCTMTINANTGLATQDNRNRYTIQLYKTGQGDPSSWTNFFAYNKNDTEQTLAWIRVNIT